MYAVIFDLLFKMLFILLLGYAFRRAGIFGDAAKDVMMTLLLKLVVPLMILLSSQNDISREALSAIAASGATAILTFAAGIPLTYLLAVKLGLDPDRRRVFVCSCTFCNIGFWGYPICQELFGDMGLLCAVCYCLILNLMFFTWGVWYLSPAGGMRLRALITNPLVICSVASLIAYVLQFRIPETLCGACSYVSSMSFPLSMLVIGCMLAESDLPDMMKDREYYIISFIKLIAVPLAAYLILRLLGCSGFILKICTVMSAIPTATIVSLQASESDVAPDYAAKAMLQTVIFTLVTLPCWVFIVSL